MTIYVTRLLLLLVFVAAIALQLYQIQLFHLILDIKNDTMSFIPKPLHFPRKKKQNHASVDKQNIVSPAVVASSSIQKVHVIPWCNELKDEYGHFIMDGILQSSRLELTPDMNDPNAIWVVAINLFPDWEECSNIMKAVDQRTHDLNMIIVDWSDWSSKLENECLEKIHTAFTDVDMNANIFISTRNLMTGRNMTSIPDTSSDLTKYSYAGVPTDFNELYGRNQYEGLIQPFRYGVRNDLVTTFEKITSSNPVRDLVLLKRESDAVHFWRRGSDAVYGSDSDYGSFRSLVSDTLTEFGSEYKQYKVHAGEVGERDNVGRNAVADLYARELLNHKIVVVAQRDLWEGHYRLMEALASGALVFTDPMYPLPYRLKHDESLIVYESMSDLKRLLKYYLENEPERLRIARAGYNIAMESHRSWHMMERLIFGDWMELHSPLRTNGGMKHLAKHLNSNHSGGGFLRASRS